MITSVGRLIAQISELAEAEGRLARIATMRVIKASLIYTVAAVFVVVGVLTLLAGVYLLLAEVMHRGAALILLGTIALVIAFAGVWLAGALERPRR